MSVRIVTPTGSSFTPGAGTKVYDAESGAEIGGILKIEIRIAPNEVTAVIDVAVHEYDGVCEALWRVRKLGDNESKPRIIKAIEYADGERVEYG